MPSSGTSRYAAEPSIYSDGTGSWVQMTDQGRYVKKAGPACIGFPLDGWSNSQNL
ncbi:hypothetical protein D3OALGA1CA_2 [Olavius algarvensis associated proteobacterium Delta 3]|nr:hypothetical protein D3OALGA1CA_2 [Olavius algarvensis associated proteobacterium Delta 3]CAB5099234.1 hypothetical protein D3OALGB2SA_1716 [Olavius algarvensis associated proteobacterium Delta 3]